MAWHTTVVYLTKNGLLASDPRDDFGEGAHFIASAPGRRKLKLRHGCKLAFVVWHFGIDSYVAHEVVYKEMLVKCCWASIRVLQWRVCRRRTRSRWLLYSAGTYTVRSAGCERWSVTHSALFTFIMSTHCVPFPPSSSMWLFTSAQCLVWVPVTV